MVTSLLFSLRIGIRDKVKIELKATFEFDAKLITSRLQRLKRTMNFIKL